MCMHGRKMREMKCGYIHIGRYVGERIYDHCVLSSPEKGIYFHFIYAFVIALSEVTMLFLRAFFCKCVSQLNHSIDRGNCQFHECHNKCDTNKTKFLNGCKVYINCIMNCVRYSTIT